MSQLLLQLDTLEAQLNSAQSSRIALSGIIARKQGAAKLGRREVAAKVDELKQSLIEHKVHHFQTTLESKLKRAAKLEEIKRKRKGTTAVVDLDLGQLAMLTVLRTLKKKYLATKTTQDNPPGFLSRELLQKIITMKNTLSSPQQDLYAKLCKNKGVALEVQQLLKSVDKIAIGVDKEDKDKSKDTSKDKSKDKSKDNGRTKDETKTKDEPKTKDESKTKNDKSKKSLETDTNLDFHEFDDENESESESQSDSESDGDSDNTGQDENEKSHILDPMEISDDESGPLPMPMTGYISGSDDEKVPDDIPIRKNRRGQRARRAIWEKKYGTKANHVQQQRKEQELAERLKLQRQQLREKAQQRRRELDSKPLHPSWQAKKLQKAAPVAFSGKKIVFE